MSARVNFVGQDGQKYGYMESVDETQTLSHVRESACRLLPDKSLPEKYFFIWKNTPISYQQEKILKVSRCCKIVAQQPRILELHIQNNSSHEKSYAVTDSGQPKSESLSIGKPNEQTIFRLGLKKFHKNEIKDPKITTLEKERRIFWNSLIDSIPQSQFKGWSLQALHGLIDTEWTLRKTKLLQLDVDHTIKRIKAQSAKSDKSDEREKKILQILDRLLKLDFQRITVYNKIEELNSELKHPAADPTKIQDQIAREEDNLDKVFTEIKSCQSNLEQSIENSNKSVDSAIQDDRATRAKESEVGCSVLLSDDDLEDIRQSVVDDYAVDNLI